MAGWKPAGEPDWIPVSDVDDVPGADAALVARWIAGGLIHAYRVGDELQVRRAEVQRLVTLTTNPAALGG
jgi:hypothetical protein